MPLLPVSEFERRLPQTVALLKDLVELESPTQEKSHIDKLGMFIADKGRSLNANVKNYSQGHAGDHWSLTWGSGEPEFLLLTHIDTVYALGTLDELPWREEGEKIFGPGVLDMKAGIAIALKDLLANFAGWIYIISRKPFEVGDRIQLGKHAGDVIDLSRVEITFNP